MPSHGSCATLCKEQFDFFMCLYKLLLWVNLLSHVLHLNFFSPVCTGRCWFNADIFGYSFPQKLHTRTPVVVWFSPTSQLTCKRNYFVGGFKGEKGFTSKPPTFHKFHDKWGEGCVDQMEKSVNMSKHLKVLIERPTQCY